jgi:hypothetical protein
MTKLNTRVSLFGLLTLGYAAMSVLVCILVGLSAMGLGTYVAFADDGSFFAGAAFGALGVFAAVIGLAVAAVQGIAGLAVMRGRKLGLLLGFVFAGLAVLSGFGGGLVGLAYGVFGLWALWTSRHQFR